MHIPDSSRAPYNGSTRCLVTSIDIGTTFTAASFCLLQPGQVPKFEEILRWPKQTTPDAKVPSVILYDRAGRPQAFGAETTHDETIMNVQYEEWKKAEWWKLHLRPSHLPLIRNLDLPALPARLQEYITSQFGAGASLWATLYPTMHVILTTPNGWEGVQQQRMRAAAIRAGLVHPEGNARVSFVTEAEAAILYASDTGYINDWLVDNGKLILCDCGGGTVDITGYKILSKSPLRMEELAASGCYLAGAVFINDAAQTYFKEILTGTEWDDVDGLRQILLNFETSAKRTFMDPSSHSWVSLGGFRSDPALGVVRGRLRIPGDVMAGFFRESLDKIQEGLNATIVNSRQLVDKIVLVGGLSGSPYIYSQLQSWGEARGLSVSRPDGPLSKAVANGALAWYIDGSVAAESASSTMEFVSKVPMSPIILLFLAEGCSLTVRRDIGEDIKVDAAKEFTSSFYIERPNNTNFHEHSVDIYAYRLAQPPKFVMLPDEKTPLPGYEKFCTVKADLGDVFRSTSVLTSYKGEHYRNVEFDICLVLGSTELTARIRWFHNGSFMYGPTTITYD